MTKKEIRKIFRNSVFKRDKYMCLGCGLKSTITNTENELDAHHITNRNLIPNGGYVVENGITLCKKKCHLRAENNLKGFEPENLYKIISSSYEKAYEKSKK